MNDALSCNHTEHETVESNCTAHGRRKFVEIENYFPQECGYVITGIREAYKIVFNVIISVIGCKDDSTKPP